MAGKGIQKARQLAAVVRDDAEAVEVEIAAHLQGDVRRLLVLIQHYQQVAGQLQGELREKLHIAHGVDIAQPGWHLINDGSRLVRQAADLRPAQPPASTAPMAQAPVVTPPAAVEPVQ